MKNYLIPILVCSFLLTGCAFDYSELKTVSNIDINKSLSVDKTGLFTVFTDIEPNDVKGEIDIPLNAVIDEVNIECISVKVIKLQDNEAAKVVINGYLREGNDTPQIFNDYQVSLAGIDDPFFGLNTLIDLGVQNLKSKIEGYLKSTDSGLLELTVSGDSYPDTGNRIHADIVLKITATVTYHTCEHMLFFMGGEKCQE